MGHSAAAAPCPTVQALSSDKGFRARPPRNTHPGPALRLWPAQGSRRHSGQRKALGWWHLAAEFHLTLPWVWGLGCGSWMRRMSGVHRWESRMGGRRLAQDTQAPGAHAPTCRSLGCSD